MTNSELRQVVNDDGKFVDFTFLHKTGSIVYLCMFNCFELRQALKKANLYKREIKNEMNKIEKVFSNYKSYMKAFAFAEGDFDGWEDFASYTYARMNPFTENYRSELFEKFRETGNRPTTINEVLSWIELNYVLLTYHVIMFKEDYQFTKAHGMFKNAEIAGFYHNMPRFTACRALNGILNLCELIAKKYDVSIVNSDNDYYVDIFAKLDPQLKDAYQYVSALDMMREDHPEMFR